MTELNNFTRRIKIINLIPKLNGASSDARNDDARLPVAAKDVLASLGLEDTAANLRVIQRDLKIISTTYLGEIDVSNSGGRALRYAWKWVNPLRVSNDELVGLIFLKKYAENLLPKKVSRNLLARFALATRGLEAAGAYTDMAAYKNWVSKVRRLSESQPLLPPAIDATVMTRVENAIMENKVLEIQYREKTEWQMIHPIGLAYRGERVYLAALPQGGELPKIYALHRIRAAIINQKPSSQGQYTMDELIADGTFDWAPAGQNGMAGVQGGVCAIKLRMKRDAAMRVLYESPLSEDQALLDDPYDSAHVLITATVRKTAILQWWILSLSDCVEVLEPLDLRNAVAERLQSALNAYQ